MKILLTILLFISFAVMAVFGIFAMNNGEHTRGGCIASIVNGAPCPNESNSFASIAFHLIAFKSFSTATFGGFIASFLMLAFVIAYLLRSLPDSLVGFSSKQESFLRFREDESSPIGDHIRQWLALHENSPSVT